MKLTSSLLSWIGLSILMATLPAVLSSAEVAVDEQAACLQCHDGLKSQINGAAQHPPARQGDCSACHNPHASRHEALLLAQPAIVCSQCHSGVAEGLSSAVVHRPVADGRCTDCHAPHGGDHEGLLTASKADLCASCHSEVVRWRELAVQHAPFRQESCQTCHEAHASEHPGLLKATGSRTCTSCHSTNELFRSRHSGYPVDQADCHQCHDPHASPRQGLFRESTHPPFADGNCGMCHQGPGTREPFRLVDREDRLCGRCHESALKTARAAPFPHVASGGTRCSSCHNPHSGQGRALLKREIKSLCLSCHDPGGFKSGQEGRYSTHSELSCAECHLGHGGDLPLLLTDNAIALCGECHSHQHAITHPMGEGTLDPRNGEPMDCLSCHGIHDAPYEKFLYRDGDRDICIACHKRKAGPN